MSKEGAWYRIKNANHIDSPALIFYPERMKKNISLLKSGINDPLRLRPHVKTHKTKEVVEMMMQEGIRKFKCATLSEAEMLGMAKAPDVLMAYQPVGPKIKRFLALQRKFPDTQFSCLVDHQEAAIILSNVACKTKQKIRVYIDLNVGMGRTGILTGINAVKLYTFCTQLKNILTIGFHFYDGHIRDVKMERRRAACMEVLAEVQQMREAICEAGYGLPSLVAGGSPSFPIYASVDGIECSPGTFILWDKGYMDGLPEQKFLPAAVIITRVVSLPDKKRLCLDIGYKSIASENELTRRIHFLNAPDLTVVSQSEEHLVVENNDKHDWKIGDMFYALPVHICPTVALYERAVIVESGMAKNNWKIIARDRKINC
jgi:D-serine deaminase-like pyridoxal phosphate-dependent protein